MIAAGPRQPSPQYLSSPAAGTDAQFARASSILPSRGMVTGDRDTTTVASQALYLLNDPFVRSQSRALAAACWKSRNQTSAADRFGLSTGIRPPRRPPSKSARPKRFSRRRRKEQLAERDAKFDLLPREKRSVKAQMRPNRKSSPMPRPKRRVFRNRKPESHNPSDLRPTAACQYCHGPVRLRPQFRYLK